MNHFCFIVLCVYHFEHSFVKCTSIINLQDGSLVVIPELSYSPMTNLELRFRIPVLIGGKGTEYGEKQNNYRIDLRLRYYFELF